MSSAKNPKLLSIWTRILIVAYLFEISFVGLVDGFTCSDPIKNLHHAVVVECRVIENNWAPIYNVTFRCIDGFEFSYREDEISYLTTDGSFEETISCTAVGCNLSDMPDQKWIERRNLVGLVVLNSFCDDSTHNPEICRPHTSFVEYGCTEGYVLDDEEYFYAKCLYSSMWDDVPECVVVKDVPPPKTTTTTAVTTATTTAAIVTTNIPIMTSITKPIPITSAVSMATTSAPPPPPPPPPPTMSAIATTATQEKSITLLIPNITLKVVQNFTTTRKLSVRAAEIAGPPPATSSLAQLDNTTTVTSQLVVQSSSDGGITTNTTSSMSTAVNLAISFATTSDIVTSSRLIDFTSVPSTFVSDLPSTNAVSNAISGSMMSTQQQIADNLTTTQLPLSLTSFLASLPLSSGFETTTQLVVWSSPVTLVAGTTVYNNVTTSSQIGSTPILPDTSGVTTLIDVPSSSSTLLTKLLESSSSGSVVTTKPSSNLPPVVTIRLAQSKATYNVCFTNYPVPNFYNRSSVKFDLIEHDIIKGIYLEGSSITYTCMFGYNPANSTLPTQTTYCQPNGKWSPIPDCVLHPCWRKVPQRPLNGRREVGLILNSFDGSTFGSHVNFTCDPFFELTGGLPRLSCIDGKWNESAIPKCTLSKNICTQIPPNRTESSILIGMNGYDVDVERSAVDKQRVKVYTTVSFACLFSSWKFVDSNRSIGTKPRRNPLIAPYTYQNSTCIGQNIWQTLPRCVFQKL